MKKILVTGSEGYIGSVLVEKLVAKGYDVTGLDTKYYSSGIVNKGNKYKLITQDIRNTGKVNLQGFDAIIHLAALSNDPVGQLDSTLTEEINFQSSINLARKAKKSGVKRFLFSSSCSIYGIAKSGEVDENSTVNPLTSYALSKINTEKELKKIAGKNFCVGILRNSTVYGYSSCLRNDLVVNNLITSALAFGEIKVLSDGNPWRPLIDIRDLSDIFIEFLTADTDKINGEIINIGFNENNFQIKTLASEIKKQLPACKIVFTGEYSDSRSYRVNFDKFRKLFPHVRQKWHLPKSVGDMINKLRRDNYGSNEFKSGKYNRLVVIKKLIAESRLDPKLYWKNMI